MINLFSNLKVEIYGTSHSEKIGVRLGGIPRGTKIDVELVQKFVDRRKSRQNAWSTSRIEPDRVVFLSGISGGVADGGVIEAEIANTNVKKSDYGDLKFIPRPSHADYVSAVKDKTGECPSGGGRFSGRLTAALAIAGGIAKQILENDGIKVLSYIREIGGVVGDNFAYSTINAQKIENIETELKSLSRADEMENAILNARADGDSVGGVVDVMAFGVPLGLGDNLFSGLEGRIAMAVFGVPAVKGVSFGAGFEFAKMLGSEANDQLMFDGKKVVTKTNNSGGINGGISNGMPIALSVAIRPTPSIAKEQDSVDLRTCENVKLSIKGRHDACIVPRALVPLESAVALAILDAKMEFERDSKN